MSLPPIGLKNDLLLTPLTIRRSTAQGQSPRRNTSEVRQNHAATPRLAGLSVLSAALNVVAQIFFVRIPPSTAPSTAPSTGPIHETQPPKLDPQTPSTIRQAAPPSVNFAFAKNRAQKNRPDREPPGRSSPTETPPERISGCRSCRGRPFLTTNIDLISSMPPAARES